MPSSVCAHSQENTQASVPVAGVCAIPVLPPLPTDDASTGSAGGLSCFLVDSIGVDPSINPHNQELEIKGKGVHSSKDLFLVSPSAQSDIPTGLLITGIILSVQWPSRQEYEIVWDTTGLSFALEKSSICHSIVKSNENRIAMLKLARFLFDKMYPSGPKSVVNVWCRDIQPRSNPNDGNTMNRTTKCGGGVATSNE